MSEKHACSIQLHTRIKCRRVSPHLGALIRKGDNTDPAAYPTPAPSDMPYEDDDWYGLSMSYSYDEVGQSWWN